MSHKLGAIADLLWAHGRRSVGDHLERRIEGWVALVRQPHQGGWVGLMCSCAYCDKVADRVRCTRNVVFEVEFRSFEEVEQGQVAAVAYSFVDGKEAEQWIDDGENIGGSGFFQKRFGDTREKTSEVGRTARKK